MIVKSARNTKITIDDSDVLLELYRSYVRAETWISKDAEYEATLPPHLHTKQFFTNEYLRLLRIVDFGLSRGEL